MKPKSAICDEHLPKRERLALKAEIAWLHKCGHSDYQLSRVFKVSPGSVNKARLHAQIGRRVATAIYAATGYTAEILILRHHRPPTPGCMVCESIRFTRDNDITTIKLCPEHALEVAKALYS